MCECCFHGFLPSVVEYHTYTGHKPRTLLEQTRRDGAGNAPKSAGEDPPSGASFIPHFRRREIGAQSAPEISDFPAPETTCLCGLTFSGAVMGNFRRWRLLVLSYFWRRPGDFPAPGTTCMCGLIVFRRRPGYFPAPTSFILSVHILPLP